MAEEQATATIPAKTTTLSREEARGVMLAAQGLLDPPQPKPGIAEVQALVERLGVVQIDTINVVRRSQYLVLWSRLGAYDEADFDAALFPRRAIFEYWAHAASILPMSDFPYYLAVMEEAYSHLWAGDRQWLDQHPEVVAQTLEAIRDRGPLASADFERSNDGRRAERWDWHGLKESRRALAELWMLGDLMVHSRRGGQKVYDLRERVLADVFGEEPLASISIPSPQERTRYFTRRTLQVLGVVVPSWLRNYFSVGYPDFLRIWPQGVLGGGSWKAEARGLFDELVRSGEAVPASIEGIKEPAYVDPARLPDLERLRAGYIPARTTFL
ncbi:MAG TPA: crosslink repair DNA glycosylase YcaQ family protein, partial [Ktedonobacterales bacterium]|nr:crosslink repair DNA glycosylase YcaQ family protein [Ktedonobacterales bacterium]